MKTAFFDMWAGGEFVSHSFSVHAYVTVTPFLCADVAPLITFLKEIQDGTIVMMASFDDASTK